jgi:phosphoribosyl 1,2-cyclic phosphodiesterase
MRVAVLGSGSRGNAIALTSRGRTVLVDAGFGLRTLRQRAEVAGVDLTQLAAVVLTHDHGDHARGAAAVAQRAGCALYGSPGTLAALRRRTEHVEAVPLATHETVAVGPFALRACRTSHDAREPVALLLGEPTSGERVGIAYDLGRPTAQVRYLLREASCLILEANHDDLMLRTGPYPAAIRERIAGPGGHLSNREAAELLGELWHPGLHTVVLAHLSDRCNTPELAKAAVEPALKRRGFRGKLLVAVQNAPLVPFEVSAEQFALDGLD